MGCTAPPPPGRPEIPDLLRLEDPLEGLSRRAAVPGPAGLALIAAFWIGAGLTAGAGAWLAGTTVGAAVAPVEALAGPVLAGLWWIPLTAGAVVLARRVPPVLPAAPTGEEPRGDAASPPRRRLRIGAPGLLVHGLAAVASSFLLNLAFHGTVAALGLQPLVGVPGAVLADGLRWMHLNGAAWVGVVALVQARDHLAASPAGRAAAGVARHGDRPAAGAVRPGDRSRRQAPASCLRVVAGPRTGLVEVDAVDWIEADGDYARVHAGGTEHLCSERLKTLARRLDERFVRVHRSSIVNVERIRSLRHLSHGDYEAVLEDGAAVRVSRRRRRELQEALDRRVVAG